MKIINLKKNVKDICFDRKERCLFAQSTFESKLLPRDNVEVISVLSEL